AQFLKLSPEQALLVRRVGRLYGLETITGGRVDRDFAISAQESRAKSDRGDMPFAGGPQAQNETQRAGREVRLIRVRHDRWIEQRRGFERIFVREVGAQHQLPFFGDAAAGTQRVPDVLEAAFEELA